MIKVLVVDDNSIELEFMKTAFEDSKIECIAVQNPINAVDLAAVEKPNFIILDLNMPGMNGLELCKALKLDERTKDIKVMFLTASQSSRDAIESVHLGAIDYISKPISRSQLVTTIISHEAVSSLKKVFAPLKQKADEMLLKYSKPALL